MQRGISKSNISNILSKSVNFVLHFTLPPNTCHLSCYASGTLQIWTALIKPYLSVTKTISLINFWLGQCHFWRAHRQRHTQNLPKSLGWRCFQQTLAKLVSEYFCDHQFLLQKWTYLIVQISGDYLVWIKTFWNTKKFKWKFSRHHGVNTPHCYA